MFGKHMIIILWHTWPILVYDFLTGSANASHFTVYKKCNYHKSEYHMQKQNEKSKYQIEAK